VFLNTLLKVHRETQPPSPVVMPKSMK